MTAGRIAGEEVRQLHPYEPITDYIARSGRPVSELILVTGGTGNLGSKVVQRLYQRGCAVRVLSRRPRSPKEVIEYAVGDLSTGAGLPQALAGVDVIVHCASASNGDVGATRNLVTAAKGLPTPPHLIYISIV